MDSSSEKIESLCSYKENFQNFNDYDFIKKIEPVFGYEDHILTNTENGFLTGYKINSEQNQFWIGQSFSHKFGSHLYDLTTIPLIQDQIEAQNDPKTLLAVSIKDNPINIYDCNLQRGTLKNVKGITLLKPSSEIFIQILDMKYHKQTNILFMSGKNTFIGYDMNTFTSAYRSKAIPKREIISCFDLPTSQEYPYFALGNFDKSVRVIISETDETIAELKGHVGGITCVKFLDNDPHQLVSGARKDNLVYLWDLRNPKTFVTYFERKAFTNQRLNFCVKNDILFLGNEDGSVFGYSIKENSLKYNFKADDEIISNVNCAEFGNSKYLITGTGERKFVLDGKNKIKSEDDEDLTDDENIFDNGSNFKKEKNKLQLWRLPQSNNNNNTTEMIEEPKEITKPEELQEQTH